MAYYGSDVPWWRVVRASGHPVADHERRALEHYRAEGTPLVPASAASTTTTTDVYRVDYASARWSPAQP
jgi:alkylated DNA nucleotide flippase Atl1